MSHLNITNSMDHLHILTNSVGHLHIITNSMGHLHITMTHWNIPTIHLSITISMGHLHIKISHVSITEAPVNEAFNESPKLHKLNVSAVSYTEVVSTAVSDAIYKHAHSNTHSFSLAAIPSTHTQTHAHTHTHSAIPSSAHELNQLSKYHELNEYTCECIHTPGCQRCRRQYHLTVTNSISICVGTPGSKWTQRVCIGAFIHWVVSDAVGDTS